MPRVILEEQEAYEFSYDIQVRVSDINAAGHLGNSEIVALVHEARSQFFIAMGVSELNLGDSEHGIILADLIFNFQAEAFMGDVLVIKCHIGEYSEKGFRIFYRISRRGDIIALAETGSVVLNYKERKPSPVPKTFKNIITEFQKKHGIS